jgi:hypothetical protein
MRGIWKRVADMHTGYTDDELLLPDAREYDLRLSDHTVWHGT